MLSSVYRSIKLQARRQSRRRLRLGKKAVRAPLRLVNEVERTLDLFRADWDIDFVLRDEDLTTKHHND